jgi:O-antigen ligase
MNRYIFCLVLVQTLPYLNIIPWDPNSRWWLHEPLLAALCLPVLPVLWRSKIIPKGYWIFVAWTGLTILYTPQEPKVAIGRFLPAILLLAGVCYLVRQIKTADDVHRLLDGFLRACSVLVGLNALAELLFPHSVSFDASWGAYAWVSTWESHEWVSNVIRFCGFMGEPNLVGSLMMVTVQAAILHWQKCKWRKLLACVVILSIIEGAMSDSRTPVVAMAVGIAGWLAFRRRNLRLKLAAVCIVLGMVALAHSKSDYVNRGAGDLNGRTWMWQWEVQKLAEHPIIGYGYAIEGLIMRDRYFPSWDAVFDDPHASLQNGYLSLAIEAGIPALLMFLFFFLRPWPTVLRSKHRFLKDAFWIVIVPALVFAMSESGIAEPRDPARPPKAAPVVRGS